MIFVTGGAGFIGSNFIEEWFQTKNEPVLNVDLLTYAGNTENNRSVCKNQNYLFTKTDIGNFKEFSELLEKYKPRAIVNFAAETHVDRSYHEPGQFVQTNVVATFHLLEACKDFWKLLPDSDKRDFRFVQISTDEVFGSLSPSDPPFNEKSRFQPNSPYAASKASGDQFVRAFNQTYGLPVLTVNCSNNYGPRQFPEKLIPLVIYNVLNGKSIPIYGDGLQVRDWLYVSDHCSAIMSILESGEVGETYNVGGGSEKSNVEVIDTICSFLDSVRPLPESYKKFKTFVTDRPGHDRRYAIDSSKLRSRLGWEPKESFESGIQKTVCWYLENESWTNSIIGNDYKRWISKNYNR